MLGQAAPFSRAALVMLVIAAVVMVWLAVDLLLLVFVGILLAIFLNALAEWLADHLRLSAGWALTTVIVALLGVMVLSGALFAPSLARQTQELAETLPDAVENLEDRIRQNTFGNWVLDRALERAAQGSGGSTPQTQAAQPGQAGGGDAAGSKPSGGKASAQGEGTGGALQDAEEAVVQSATGAARRLVDGLVALVIVIFTGVYLAAHPQPYIRGALRLFPIPRRQRIGEVLYAAGYTLRWWLFGQLLAMTVVGLLMGIGLAIIGVPLAFALGVVAGLFEFIPTIGPVIGLAPALVLALTQAPAMALWVLGLYGIVQTIESYLLTPLVQQRVIHLPPVVTIVTQVFFGWTIGALGLLVAVPLVAVLMTVVQMLYVEDFLGDDMQVDAEAQGKIDHEKAAPLADEDDEDEKDA
jgi:predicted PurR-regulated permease PerM